jgi:hypothetical protein
MRVEGANWSVPATNGNGSTALPDHPWKIFVRKIGEDWKYGIGPADKCIIFDGISYSDTVISRFGSGLLLFSVALALGSPGMLPLWHWRSICLHISPPFSGGMVVNFHFILFHHITWS